MIESKDKVKKTPTYFVPPKVRSIKDLRRVVEAMWLVGKQTHIVTVADEKMVPRLVREAKKNKIPVEVVVNYLRIHLPYGNPEFSYFNPYDSDVVMRT